MKDITFGFVLSMLLTTLMFGMSLSLFAQGNETPTVIKKEIKIVKMVGEDGNITVDTITTEVEVSAEDWNGTEEEFDIDIDIDETMENGIKKRIVRVQVDGEDGELPQELQDELESLGIDINIIDGSEKRTIIVDPAKAGDNDIRIFKIDSDEEMPEDIRRLLEEEGIDLDEIKKEGGQGIRMFKTEGGFGGNDNMNRFFREGNTDVIDRQTKIFRITSIDDLDNEIIDEVEEMGVSVAQLRERFDAALNTVRIYKEGLQPAEVEVDAPMSQQQMFFIGDDEEVVEINPNMDFNWVEEDFEVETEKLEELEGKLEEMQRRMGDAFKDKPYLGITMRDNGGAVVVLDVAEDSPAAKAGLKEDDIITTLNSVKIENTEALIEEIQKMKVGDALQIGYTRANQTYTTNATLAKREMPNFRHIQRMEMPQMPNMPRIPRIATERGHLGVNLDQDATILRITPESPAAEAGLEAGDRLTKIGDINVATADDVISAMEKALPGTNTDVTFQRGDDEYTVTVVPAMPPHRHHKRFRHKNTCSPDDKAHWMKRMEADCEKRCSTPFLGIYMEERNRDSDEYDVKITGIVQNTGAEDAGILEDDILLKVNRASISNVQDVVDEISKYEPGDRIKVQVLRDGKKKRIKATLSNQTQADIFSPCDCSTGEVNTEAMIMREIILIKENPADVRIDIDTGNTLNLDNIDLFPNPNNGTFTVRFATESKTPTTVSVISVTGKEVYREVIQDFNGRYDNRIDISNQAKGTYFLNITQGDKVYTEQIILGTK